MNYYQLETSLLEAISPADHLAFYRKRAEVIRVLESKIQKARNQFIKKCHIDSLELIKKATPDSVSWRARAAVTKANSALDSWDAL